ncbi:MAG: MerR family transcriptional regulator [Anaerolineae bacterium]
MNSLHLENASDEPLYNIGMVARMTGIPVATLRVWERRYGFPTAARTPGEHRLFSEREVLRLRWVKAQVDEGMQTSQAIRTLQHVQEEGRLPDILTTPAPARPPVSDPSLSAFHNRLLELLIDSELQQADQLMGEILTLYPLEDLILDVVTPTMHDIGLAWLAGEISVAAEHLATNFLRQHLLMWMITGPAPFDGVPPVVLVCAPDEWHEGSLMIMGVLLRRRRWPVAYLGQSVPLTDVAALAEKIHTPAVVFVSILEKGALALQEWPTYFPQAAATGRPLVAYGGQIFVDRSDLRDNVQGLYLGDTLRDGIEKLDATLHTMFTPRA